MSTAETLVKEYLDRGYSLEALRLVAESRQQPLGSEMLAIINAMEQEAEPVPCETGNFSPVGDNMVFFVANDDESVVGEEVVDFDLMAATQPEKSAAKEESVVDILIGETDGSGVVPVKPPPALEISARPAKQESGIWSRIWSRMHRDAAPGPAPAAKDEAFEAVPPEQIVELAKENVGEGEPPLAVREGPDQPAAEGGDIAAAANQEETVESPAARDEVEVLAAAVHSDYIPGEAGANMDAGHAHEAMDDAKRLLEEAKEALAASIANSALEENAREAHDEAVLGSAASDEADSKISRRERRRRERVQKKKGKRAKKSEGASLPEIVLTRSEGTETLVPEAESGDVEAEAGAAGELMNVPAPAAMSETVDFRDNEAPQADVLSSDGAPSAEAVVDDGAQSSAAAESGDAPVAMAATEAEAADPIPAAGTSEAHNDNEGAVAAEAASDADASQSVAESADSNLFSGSDHLMILASGGLDIARIESQYEQEDEPSAESNNVILFREKFPVFTGGAEEMLDDGDVIDFHPVLRVLPPIDSIEDESGENLPVEPIAQPVAEEVTEPVAEEAPEPIVEEVAESVAEPAAEEAVGPVAEEVSEPVAEPVAEEIPEPVALPAAEAAPVEEQAALPQAALEDMLSAQDRLSLLRALAGAPYADEFVNGREEAASAPGHCIVPMAAEPAPSAEMEREVAVRKEMEEEYQARLNEFASRILQAQAATAERESRLREKDEEMGKRDATLGDMKKSLEEEEKKQQALGRKLDEARREVGAKQAELERMNGLQDEHCKLYDEFEDLRRAYNEVVTDVMPELQGERDDLALTVERQCEKEKDLRGVITSSRRRLAASYVLGAAACLMLIALPVANWMKAGVENKDLALEHQQVSELRENYNSTVEENIRYKNEVVEMERKLNRARMDLTELREKNKELNQMAMANPQGISVFPPAGGGSGGGTPTRMSEMALQGTPAANGRLHTNQVRDPAGSIESLYAQNRTQNEPGDRQMAQAPTNREPMLSAPARSPERRNGLRPEQAAPAAAPAQRESRISGLRPENTPPLPPTRESASAPTVRNANPTPRQGEVMATVKRGEGVAQVVYRVLGTWDPEVVSWVIRENKIRTDRRGNPIIQPDQELRLPKEGRTDQAASAARRQ